MSRAVVYRVLPAGWAAIQQVEKHLLNVAGRLPDVIRDYCCKRASCKNCRAASADRAQAADLLRACATGLHALWLPHERAMSEADSLLAEAVFAFMAGDDAGLDAELPEAGLRINGPGLGLYLRYADSTSTDEPELCLIEELTSE